MKLSERWLEHELVDSRPGRYRDGIIQIGDGVFLRGFVDWLIHQWNVTCDYQTSVVVVKPLPSRPERIAGFNEQNGLYTVWLRGLQQGQVVDSREIMSSVSRALNPYEQWEAVLDCARNPDVNIMVSNTTEAGLAYLEEPFQEHACPSSFPGKVTAYLYERYLTFEGSADSGMDIVPCELVENNGNKLKELVLKTSEHWVLPSSFSAWIEQYNNFYNTLVDSIVTSFDSIDKERLQTSLPYEDAFGVIREPFYFWALQGPQRLAEKWNFPDAKFNVRFVHDVAPFRLIKVRILNGAHTALAGLATIAGVDTVRETVNHSVLGRFVQQLLSSEVIPTLTKYNISPAEAEDFAESVLERFANPFLRHEIKALQLNAETKVKVRLLPTIRDYVSLFGTVPPLLVCALAAQMLVHPYGGTENQSDKGLGDMWDSLQSAASATSLLSAVTGLLSSESVWGDDLSKIDGLVEAVCDSVQLIQARGVIFALTEILPIQETYNGRETNVASEK